MQSVHLPKITESCRVVSKKCFLAGAPLEDAPNLRPQTDLQAPLRIVLAD